MEQHIISNIKAQFGELIYKDPSLLQTHDLAKQSLLLYQVFQECLKCHSQLRITSNPPDLTLLSSDQIIKFEFALDDSTKKVIVKILYLKDEQQFSFNCLKKFDREELFSFKIQQQKENEKLDDFIQRAADTVYHEFIIKIGFGSRQGLQGVRRQDFDDVNLRPRNIGDDIFRQPYHYGSRQPYQPVRPNIRFDPITPPNIGGGDLGPTVHPMFPEFQTPGTQMGPRDPYFRGQDTNRGFGGFGLGGRGSDLW